MDAATAVQEQTLRDNLQVMDGGYMTLRGNRYCVCPRAAKGHVVEAGVVFQAIDAGLAFIRNRHVQLTEAGYRAIGVL